MPSPELSRNTLLDLAALAGFCLVVVWGVYHPADSTALEQGDALGLSISLMLWASITMWVTRVSPTLQWQRVGWWVDAAPLALATWVFVAAWVSGGVILPSPPQVGGDLRAATNEAWWWIACGAAFVALRRLLAGTRRSTAMFGLLLGMGAMLAVHTLHQYYVSFPQMLSDYQNDPDGMLAKIGLNAEPGSAARMIFENRLRDGGPTGTFALANSLAGPLAMTLTFAGGCLLCWLPKIRQRDDHAASGLLIATAASLAGMTLIALASTGSRSGLLSVIVVAGLTAGLALLRRRPLRVKGEGNTPPAKPAKSLAIVGSVLAVVVLSLFAALWKFGESMMGGEWVTQAPATIQLRMQYWRSTLGIAADHPWFGAGPGNFQLVYQKYRDILAHELIAEPHNFFFETLACGGWIASALLVAWLVTAIVAYLREVAASDPATNSDDAGSTSTRRIAIAVGTGTIAGIFAVWYHGISTGNLPDFDAHLIAVPVALGSIGIWLHSMHRTHELLTMKQCRHLAGASAATGLIHLCFSGGWTVPGVSVFLLAFAAIATATPGDTANGETQSNPTVMAPRIAAISILAILAATAFFFSYRPVSRSRAAMAESNMLASTNRAAAAEETLRRALDWDPLNSDLAIWLATLENRKWLQSIATTSATARQQSSVEASFDEAIKRSGNDPARLRAICELLLQRYQVAGQLSDLVKAEEIISRARELSPTHEAITAQHAEILRELERLGKPNGNVSASELAERAEMLATSGGVITRVLGLQPILPARVVGRAAIDEAFRAPADTVLFDTVSDDD
ncbi:O-antigen ligase family protein [Aporhodopirellula aestuarii]|uniref:O-antigen ligase family protein n=1 Tax=Aporhodopirellula aestuarii TaxID=2950107 RepID=A0ABT0TX77_9BACT|nr:O-antigen ligase family protein [Aporhodopirellula aestuarii]MCM2369201.1 O-antigen ligase family protein [Aporhodopirellula aestuarii]